MIAGRYYRLVVLVDCGGGSWSTYYTRDGLASLAQAELLGQEEVCRVLFRTVFRRAMVRVDTIESV
jgi:hypothetical protein